MNRILVTILLFLVLDVFTRKPLENLTDYQDLCQPDTEEEMLRNQESYKERWIEKGKVEVKENRKYQKTLTKNIQSILQTKVYQDGIEPLNKRNELKFGKFETDQALYGVEIKPNQIKINDAQLYVRSFRDIEVVNYLNEQDVSIYWIYTDNPAVTVHLRRNVPIPLSLNQPEMLRIEILPSYVEDLYSFVTITLQFTDKYERKSYLRTFPIEISVKPPKNPFDIQLTTDMIVRKNSKGRFPIRMYNPFKQDLAVTMWKPRIPDNLLDISIDFEVEYVQENRREAAYLVFPPDFKNIFATVNVFGVMAGIHSLSLGLEIEGTPLEIPIWVEIEKDDLIYHPITADFGVLDPRYDRGVALIRGSNRSPNRIEITEYITLFPVTDRLIVDIKPQQKYLNPYEENVPLYLLELKNDTSFAPGQIQGKIAVFTTQSPDSHDIFLRIVYIEAPFVYNRSHAHFVLNPNSLQFYEDQVVENIPFKCNNSKLIRLKKTIQIQSNLSFPIVVHDFGTNNPKLSLLNFEKLILYPEGDSSIAKLTVSYVFNPNKTEIPNIRGCIYLYSYGFTFTLPFDLYDMRVVCTIHRPGLKPITRKCLNIQKELPIIDFGILALNENKNVTLSILNPNPQSIRLMEGNESERKCLKITLEKELNQYKKTIKPNNYGLDNLFLLELNSDHEVFLTITPISSKAGKFQGKMAFITDSMEYFELHYQFEVLNGTIEFIPPVVDLTKGLFGLNYTMNVEIKNNFPKNCKVEKLYTSDSRIIAELSNYEIRAHQSEKILVKIFPDAQTEEYLKNARGMSPNGVITVEDLKRWQSIREIKKNFKISNRNYAFDADVYLHTDILKSVEFKVMGKFEFPQISPPQIILDSFPKFTTNEVELTFNNPSDDYIFLEFFIGPDDLVHESYLTELIMKNRNKVPPKNNCATELTLEGFKNCEHDYAAQLALNESYILPIQMMTNRQPTSIRRRINQNLDLFDKAWNLITARNKKTVDSEPKSALRLQSFYLNPAIRKDIIILPPKSSRKLNPISLNLLTNKNTGLLLVKNNLTGIEAIKLEGSAGEPRLSVLDMILIGTDGKTILSYDYSPGALEQEFSVKVLNPLFRERGDNSSEDSRDKYEDYFIGYITILNEGEVPLVASSISVENSGCMGYDIEVVICEPFILPPKQIYNMSVRIHYGFGTKYLQRTIYFDMGGTLVDLNVKVKFPEILRHPTLFGYEAEDYDLMVKICTVISIVFLMVGSSLATSIKLNQIGEKDGSWSLRYGEANFSRFREFFQKAPEEPPLQPEIPRSFRNDLVKRAVAQIFKPNTDKKHKHKPKHEAPKPAVQKEISVSVPSTEDQKPDEPKKIEEVVTAPEQNPLHIEEKGEHNLESNVDSNLDSHLDSHKESKEESKEESKLNESKPEQEISPNNADKLSDDGSYHSEPRSKRDHSFIGNSSALSVSCDTEDRWKLKEDADEILSPREVEMSVSKIGMIGESRRHDFTGTDRNFQTRLNFQTTDNPQYSAFFNFRALFPETASSSGSESGSIDYLPRKMSDLSGKLDSLRSSLVLQDSEVIEEDKTHSRSSKFVSDSNDHSDDFGQFDFHLEKPRYRNLGYFNQAALLRDLGWTNNFRQSPKMEDTTSNLKPFDFGFGENEVRDYHSRKYSVESHLDAPPGLFPTQDIPYQQFGDYPGFIEEENRDKKHLYHVFSNENKE